MIKWPEPVSLLRCHTAQEAYHYTEAQLKQAVRDAYEDAAKVATTTCHHEATFFANGFNQAALNIEAGLRALIKEIPE